MTPATFRDWRKRLGLTQAEAADRIGVGLRVVSYYETGERDGKPVEIPKPVAYACAAIALGMSPHP